MANIMDLKMKILSFTHSYAVPNLYGYCFSVKHKRRRLAECPCCSFSTVKVNDEQGFSSSEH